MNAREEINTELAQNSWRFSHLIDRSHYSYILSIMARFTEICTFFFVDGIDSIEAEGIPQKYWKPFGH